MKLMFDRYGNRLTTVGLVYFIDHPQTVMIDYCTGLIKSIAFEGNENFLKDKTCIYSMYRQNEYLKKCNTQ